MSEDSTANIEQRYKRLGERAAFHDGSAWDRKIHGPTGLCFVDLRFKVGECIVESGWKIRDAAKHFSVSPGFVIKWSQVYRDWKEINEALGRDAVLSKDAFTSITNRPKNVMPAKRNDYVEIIIQWRTAFPFYGSRKIKAKTHIDLSLSSIDKVLRENGLTKPYNPRHKKKHHGSFEKMEPFDMVQIDFKTWDNGLHSIFVIDDSSRFILSHIISEKHTFEVVREVLEEMYRTWHVYPKKILSDHGTEFYSVRGGKGKSALDIWCKERGIEHVMGAVRHPQTQGKIERSHLSAELEIRYFGKFDNLENSRETMRKWVEFYNMERPHQSLGDRCPFDVFFEKFYGDNLSDFINA